MSTPVISADAAQCLNQKVQQLIDSRLFLCCNYEPTVSYAISEEGQYFTAIQDLYKFAIDSSCIIKCYDKFIHAQQELSHFKGLRDILDCIDVLRSVTDHNQSRLNGRMAKERLENYSIWLQQCLGKDAPESPADFLVLYRKTHTIAEELLAYLNQFIELLGVLSDKTDVTQKWIDCTLRWYCSNTKTEIYKGQLMDAYIANATANGKNYQSLYRPRELYRKINRWIEASIFYPIDHALEEIEAELQSAQTILCGNSPMVQALRPKMTEEQFETFVAGYRSRLEESERKRQSLLQEKEKIEKEVGKRPADYLFKRLEQQLRDTMVWLEAKGTPYTLLPQDLLQENIELHFGSVHSPEMDF